MHTRHDRLCKTTEKHASRAGVKMADILPFFSLLGNQSNKPPPPRKSSVSILKIGRVTP